MNQERALNKANENLQKIYGDKHTQITMQDIEKTYERNLLGLEADAKTRKGSKLGYLTGILYLAPSTVSGINTCPAASAGCAQACLFSAGRGIFYGVFRARVIKTLAFFFDKERFAVALDKSIEKVKRKANRENMVPVIRLNGTSDIMWDRITSLITKHSDTQFYDYTKIARRFTMPRPSNYDLTFSLHETNSGQAMKVLQNGGRVAVVFRKDIPATYWGVRVIDGDSTDLRFLDPQNCIVGLKAKGRAKKDESGFVQDVAKAPAMTQRIVVNYI